MPKTDVVILRSVLAFVWLVTAALTFGLYPVDDSLQLLQRVPLEKSGKLVLVYAGAMLDLAMGVLTLVWPRRLLWLGQLVVVAGYTVLATMLVPELWLHPFGPLLKNLAVLAVIWLLYRHTDQGRNNA